MVPKNCTFTIVLQYLILFCQCLVIVSTVGSDESFRQIARLKGYQILVNEEARSFSNEITNHVTVSQSTFANEYKIEGSLRGIITELYAFHWRDATIQLFYEENIFLLIRNNSRHDTLRLSFRRLEDAQIFHSHFVPSPTANDQTRKIEISRLTTFNADTNDLEKITSTATLYVTASSLFPDEKSFVVKSTNPRIQGGTVQVPYVSFYSRYFHLSNSSHYIGDQHVICISVEGDDHVIIYCLQSSAEEFASLYTLLSQHCSGYF